MSVSTIKPHSSSIARWLMLTAVGYAVLVTVSLWLPIGLHRIISGRRGWWHFSIGYGLLFAGGCVWFAGGRYPIGIWHPVSIVASLTGGAYFFGLLIADFATLWLWHWPFTWTVRERFDALQQRLNLRANATLLLIVALSMFWLSRVV